MKAKLYIKGLREPIEVDPEEGIEAQRVITDPKVSKDTPFSIENVWTGTKFDMKFVVFPEKEQTFDSPVFSVMSKTEYAAFNKELEPFRKEAVRAGWKEYEGDLFWMQSKGAIKISERKGTYVSLYRDCVSVSDPIKFKDADAKIDSFNAYRDRIAYAKAKDLAGLAAIAETI
jgi:hypothetical protein